MNIVSHRRVAQLGRASALALSILGLSFGPAARSAAQPFEDVTPAGLLVSAGDLAWGDADNDGDLDLLITGYGSGFVRMSRLYRNDGGVFVNSGQNLPALAFSAVAWIDCDGDGDLDFGLGGNPGGRTTCAVYLNNGSGAFTQGPTMLWGTSTSEMAWGDADGDGDPDLLLAEYGGVFRNDRGPFTWTWLGLPGVGYGAGRWADYDKDGDLDLLLAGNPGNNIFNTTLYQNDGASGFTNSGAAFAPAFAGGVAWGDFDNDGDADLLRADLGGTTLYRNQGNGTFVDSGIELPSVDRGGVAWGDYDSDGFLDFALTGLVDGTTGLTRIFRNLGGTNFTDSGVRLANVSDAMVAWGDFDNDRDLDLAFTGDATGGPLTKIYRNDTTQKNTAPSAPTNLVMMVRGNSITMSWAAATDTEQAGGLSYNLRVGGPPSYSGNIMPPSANVVTGLRRIPAVGNAQQRTSWTITNLPPGLYRWSVQAIDHSYAGSLFGLPQDFRISAPPTISDITNRTMPGGTTTQIIPFFIGDDITPATNLVVTASSSDVDVLPATNIELGNTNAVRWLRLTPAPGSVGTTLVTVTVTDGEFNSTSDTFLLTATNTLPSISDIPNASVPLFGSSPPLAFTVGDMQTPAEDLFVYAVSSNTNVVPQSGVVLGGSFSNRTLTITPSTTQCGTATITVTVVDAHFGTNADTVVVTVAVFNDIGAGLPALAWGGTDWVDYDNDGDLDAFYTGSSNSVSAAFLFRNDGADGLHEVTSGLPGGSGPSSVAWGDYNNDGLLDVLLNGYNGTRVFTSLFRNTGHPSAPFTDSGAVFPSLATGTAAWGDFDNDGDLDLWLSGNTTNFVRVSSIYRNNHDGTFTEVQAGLRTAANAATAAWGDFDNDGDLDLLLRGNTSLSTGFAAIYRNNGDGSFTDINAGLSTGPSGRCAWGDSDNDGDLDILMSGADRNRAYRNRGGGTFSDVNAPLLPASEVAWADYDGDGFLDVLQGGNGSGLRLWSNNGFGGFFDAQAGLPPVSVFSVAWGDYDADGDLDVLLLGFQDGTNFLSILRNGLTHSNSPPTAPSNLAATILQDASVLLTWDRSADAETTNAAGLNYNLRVGTSPGGIDVVSPGADLVTGFLRVPRLGNAGPTNRWRLVDLPGGTYYWSVQAVDPSFAGSTFGAEASFTITNTRPRLSPVASVATSHRFPVVVPFTIGDAETPAGQLNVAASSSNTNSVPAANFLFSGAGSNRTVQITPMPDRVGTSVVTLVVTDGGGISSSRAFSVAVTNAPPTLSSIGNLTIAINGSTPPLPFTIGDLETPAQRLTLTASTAETKVVAPSGLVFGGFGSNRTLTVTPLAGQAGFARIRLRVTDSIGTTVERLFTLTVSDPPPVISEIPDQYFPPGAVIPPISFAVSDTETPSSNLVVRALTSNPALIPATNLVLSGAESNRTLTLTPLAGQRGTAVIIIEATDQRQRTTRRTFLLVIDDLTVPPAVLPALGNGSSASWGDYDHDGRLDLLLTGRDPSGSAISRIYRNGADGSFSNIFAQLPGIEYTPGFWGDFDNDGFLDALLVESGPNIGRFADVLRNNHDGTFSRLNSGLPLTAGGFASPVDFDGDGDLDVLFGGFVADAVAALRLYRNNGAGIFSVALTSLPAMANGSAAWGDYDKDGDVDLVLVGRLQNQSPLTRLFRNDGGGAFTEADAGLPQQFGLAAWGDFDGDGWLDLTLSGGPGGVVPVTRLFRNVAGAFTNIGVSLPAVSGGTLAWGDYDNDGRPDLLLAGTSTNRPWARIFRNDHGTNFTEFPDALPGISSGTAAWGDYDNDGDLDVVLTGGVTQIHTNNATVSNTPPTAPASLASTISPGFVLLTWMPSSDAETTNASGLRYNLRVGTTAGGEEVLSPQSDLATGRRRLAAPGNAGTANHWRLRLPPGTYYWSVQAIDPALAGSPFAVENSFTIPNTPPAASDLFLTTEEDFPIAFTLPASDPDNQALTYLIVDAPLHGSLLTAGAEVLYVPPTNFFGLDRFTWQVGDSLASSQQAQVQIEVTPVADVAATRFTSARIEGGIFHLTFGGEPYRHYRLEASVDLEHWSDLATLIAAPNGTLTFAETVPGAGRRFYRASLVE